ncbi:MAG: class I SAM-dependent methyltransferase [Ferruginibacter sp.]
MSIQESYNEWADQYDSNQNKTRDLEAIALRESLKEISFESCLEIGCGTGKNTEWLQQNSTALKAVDFSEGMLKRAREKITASHVQFVQADITKPWDFAIPPHYDLITFSLVLEHIENLDFIFQQSAAVLKKGACMYIGELHPYKQYAGSKARFETSDGTHELRCYTHHISDFLKSSRNHGLELMEIKEFIDEETGTPRILVMVFENHSAANDNGDFYRKKLS